MIQGDMEIDIEEDEINKIMEAEDTDGDGTLDFDEFLSLLNGAGAGRELVEVFEQRSYKLAVYSAVRTTAWQPSAWQRWSSDLEREVQSGRFG